MRNRFLGGSSLLPMMVFAPENGAGGGAAAGGGDGGAGGGPAPAGGAAPSGASATLAGGAGGAAVKDPPAAGGDAPAAGAAAAGGGASGGDPAGQAGAGSGGTPAGGAAQPDWRDAMAGDDKAFRERLNRFADPSMVGKSYRELEAKISSGQYKPATPFPKEGTAEEQAAWRKDMGVPEGAEAYKLELPQGVVPGEADKPALGRLAAMAHSQNWSNAQYNQAVEAYYREIDAAHAARSEADAGFRQDSTATLQKEWGGDFKRNTAAVANLTSTWPKDVADALLGGRTADGRLIGDHPGVLKVLAQTALDLNPAASVLPAGRQDISGIEQRKGELKAMMADQASDYWKGPKSGALQKEYRDLLDAEQRLAKRSAA